MTGDDERVSGDTTSDPGPTPIGLCVVRSEPMNRSRLYSITVTLDVVDPSRTRHHRTSSAEEVLRIVGAFLKESSQVVQ